MNPGQLRHRVTLQTQVATQDALGQPSTSWLDTVTVWSDIRHLNGLEAIKGGLDMSVVKASIRIRYRAVNAGQRVLYGSQVYDIKAVLPDPKKTYCDLVCESINVAV